jgi:hypothetical protein
LGGIPPFPLHPLPSTPLYSACLFCNKPLGANESLETFPVGKRLAFDAAKGRLWVVCPHCERWNLTPLEERWEAIEQAEKFYRDTRRRVSTDNIGLAKLRSGVTLIRIGEPLRPEFAAWRYGDQFGRRRRRQMLIAGGGIAALSAVVIGGLTAGIGIGGFGWMLANSGRAIIEGSGESVVAKIRSSDGRMMHVRRRHLGETIMSRSSDGELALFLRFKNGQAEFKGREAERIASIVVPKVNRYGGDKKAVASAVEEIEARGGAEGYLDRLTRMSETLTRPAPRKRSWWQDNKDFTKHGLYSLPRAHRLALEMALHEEAERRAVQGELADLERAWREAEEIAGIADSLLLPDSVVASVQRLRGAQGSGEGGESPRPEGK